MAVRVGVVLRVSGRLGARYLLPWAQKIADAPLDQMPQISWGNAVLAATYRGLCLVVSRPTSMEGILLRCPLLLQMWIHERFDIGWPKADISEYQTLPEDTDPADLPPWVLCGASGR
jgi:hypothetical protein